jgi:shikimate dehydrogenase
MSATANPLNQPMPTMSYAVGLIGRGIGSSRSPAIHETQARELGVPLVYRIVDFDRLERPDTDLEAVIRMLVAIGWAGCNITHPYKQAALLLCDTLSAEARALGAVNTLIFRDGHIHGDNTDWSGFSWMIERQIGAIAGSRVGQIGAGGAGSATAYALARLGVSEVAVFDPAVDRANALKQRLSGLFPHCRFVISAAAQEAISGREGIVQTTPVGMDSHLGIPFDPELLTGARWLVDIIYFPLETALLSAARARGIKTVNGLGMVVGQAAQAFGLLTGYVADRERMLSHVMAATK